MKKSIILTWIILSNSYLHSTNLETLPLIPATPTLEIISTASQPCNPLEPTTTQDQQETDVTRIEIPLTAPDPYDQARHEECTCIFKAWGAYLFGAFTAGSMISLLIH